MLWREGGRAIAYLCARCDALQCGDGEGLTSVVKGPLGLAGTVVVEHV